ncbi:MAG: VanZ family protein [Clostridiales bacterium]|nr:VanZ family protein [Clostridiales bacterium]
MKKYKILLWILIIIMLAVIFAFSCQSSEKSVALSRAVAQEQQNITAKIVETDTTEINDFIVKHIRSMAHCILYLCLAILVFMQCRFYGLKPVYAFVLSLLCCFLYGLTDEFHQRFTEGRTSCMEDVIKDTFGAFVGSTLCCIKEKLFKIFKGVRK